MSTQSSSVSAKNKKAGKEDRCAIPRIYPGTPYPLGATWDGKGVNFAIFSTDATKVELCLFDNPDATSESGRVVLPEYTDHVWHGYLPDARPGQLYGFRVSGPYEPTKGLRFNPNKLLLDPYAKSIVRNVEWHPSVYGYMPSAKAAANVDLRANTEDSAAYAPLAAVIDPAFSWGDDTPPKTPWHKTIIYEAHVKGLTMQHPDVPEELRGTYAGMACDVIIQHLLDLGITALELMPVQQHVDEHFLVEKGLSNYWGYNTIGFFAPDLRFAANVTGADGPVREFKTMVRTLHAAGIEVIMDVVYNHTAEGNHLGPTLSFKGIDNKTYYRLLSDNKRYYMDYTGCGNTINVTKSRTLQLIMDSLRYWVQEMHVDGFRFDLASALVRGEKDVDTMASFFDIIHQDPVLSQVKLIAEPWDLGEGGYQVGNFPVLWTEWNGKYRDISRRFWKGDNGTLSEMATRIAGSSDLYENTRRNPHASINFVTSHDGFTLEDLVSYNDKHNLLNKEDNRDGDAHNNSWNCGAEGPSEDPHIVDLRGRQKRNMMATLLLSLGVPMILGGDEIGRTQQGNNNAYCQDNEISWLNWELSPDQEAFLSFTKRLIKIRKEHPVFQRRKFFMGKSNIIHGAKDLHWYTCDGREMNEKDWRNDTLKCMGAMLDGNSINELDETGKPITGKTMLLLSNTHTESVNFKLPKHSKGKQWQLLIDTADPNRHEAMYDAERNFHLEDRSLALLVLKH